MVELLESKGFLENDDGRMIMFGDKTDVSLHLISFEKALENLAMSSRSLNPEKIRIIFWCRICCTSSSPVPKRFFFLVSFQLPLTVVKSDGGYTYDTSDMAAIQQRIEEEKADWVIYLTDSGQSAHFMSVFDCARKAGILTERIRVDHVAFGVVLGMSFSKSSRLAENVVDFVIKRLFELFGCHWVMDVQL